MKTVLKLLLMLVVTSTSAQYNYGDSNRIGISGGINQFNLITNDINTTAGIGWNLGLSLRGNFYNDFDMVYGIQFSENRFDVRTNTINGTVEDVELTLPSAQISLLLSYKVIPNHLSVEIGPMVQVNGEFKFEDISESNIVDKTTITVKDLADISRFNFYPTIGVTGGIRNARLAITYQYGVNNMLSGEKGEEKISLKGNGSILSANLLLYL